MHSEKSIPIQTVYRLRLNSFKLKYHIIIVRSMLKQQKLCGVICLSVFQPREIMILATGTQSIGSRFISLKQVLAYCDNANANDWLVQYSNTQGGGGGGGGNLIFSSYVDSGPASTVHPPKISGISSTPKNIWNFSNRPQKYHLFCTLTLRKRS